MGGGRRPLSSSPAWILPEGITCYVARRQKAIPEGVVYCLDINQALPSFP